MEGSEGRGPGYDDWFDEPEPPSDTQTGAGRGVYDNVEEEVWVVPEEDDSHARRRGGDGIVIGGRTFTTTQVVVLGVSLIAVILALLAAFGAFSSTPQAETVTTQLPQKTVTRTTSTQTTSTVQAPTQTLQPGDTGAQVIALQRSLNSLGYSVGKPDGDYGPATQNAVEQFQAANNLATDGVVGQQTLAKLNQALSG